MAGTVITKKGLQLIAKLVASGTALTFTRVSVGTGSVPAGYDPGNMTDLNNYKMDGSISSCSFLGDEASIIMQISSLGVETGFTITETGLFATDPDEGEILYSYLDLSKDPQYVYEENSAISKFVEMTLVVKVGTVERVTAQLNPHSLLTRDGDISDTSINELEPIDTKYPIPAAGETTKVFMGKVKKYIEDTKPLDANMTIYVATTGNNTTGDGTLSKPFGSIQYAIDSLPKDLGGYTATIAISDGTYSESLNIRAFHSGGVILRGNSINVIVDSPTVNAHYITDTSAQIRLEKGVYKGSGVNTNSQPVFILQNSNYVHFMNTTIDGANTYSPRSGIYFRGSIARILSVIFNNCRDCFYILQNATNDTVPSDISIRNCSGTNNVRVLNCRNSTIHLEDNIRPQASNADIIEEGGLIVKPYGAIIGTLRTDTTLYVATTGSDTTGDGTSAKPYRTIQYALNALPKDLGSLTATVIIANGTYDENLDIYGFINGKLLIRSNTESVDNSVIIKSIHAFHCACDLWIQGVTIAETTSQNAIIADVVKSLTINYTSITNSNLLKTCILAWESIIHVANSRLSNHAHAIYAGQNCNIYSNSNTGSGNQVGICSTAGGKISCSGTQPTGIRDTATATGGVIFQSNGTQISDIISSGLSCTWGTLAGGYIRHGNVNGVAMVTVELSVSITSSLTAGTVYYITGFPTGLRDIPCNMNVPKYIDSLYMRYDGVIYFRPLTTVGPNQTIVFGCTYLTTS